MSEQTPSLLADIAAALTGVDRAGTHNELAPADGQPGDRTAVQAAAFIQRLLQQAPMSHTDRSTLLTQADRLLPSLAQNHPGSLIEVEAFLRGARLRIPLATGPMVFLPPLTVELTEVYETLIDLDSQVSEPWTLIGGLMVLTHCAEHGRAFTRPTGDADVAVSVFTHRLALRTVTARLAQIGFRDVTSAPLAGGPQLSYRWARSEVKVDVAVPLKANEQREAATSFSGRPSVELPAVQQALQRTQRLPVTLANGFEGHVRRPDLLGSVVIKAAAAADDRRNPARHREDLVVLADILAASGQHTEYAHQVRPKDAKRIHAALASISDREWRGAIDPEAARAALRFLVQHPDVQDRARTRT